MSTLITGGGGFLGSHVCELMSLGGREVVCLDVKPFEFTGEAKNKIRTRTGDVTNLQTVTYLVQRENVKNIIAVAAIAGSAKCAQIPLRAFEVNVLGLANVLECARINNLNVLYVSSNSVYGKRTDLRSIKESDPMNPDTVYRRSKALGEEVCQMYISNYNVSVNIVRPGVIYGPRLPFASKLTYLLHCAVSGEKAVMPNGAEERVDYVYVKDVAAGIVAADNARDGSNHVYNIASGESPTLLEIAIMIQQVVGDFEFEIGPGYLPGGGWVQGPLDISLARSEIGYRPTPMRDAIAEYVEWIRAHPGELSY